MHYDVYALGGVRGSVDCLSIYGKKTADIASSRLKSTHTNCFDNSTSSPIEVWFPPFWGLRLKHTMHQKILELGFGGSTTKPLRSSGEEAKTPLGPVRYHVS